MISYPVYKVFHVLAIVTLVSGRMPSSHAVVIARAAGGRRGGVRDVARRVPYGGATMRAIPTT